MIVVGTSALKYFGAVTEAKDHDVWHVVGERKDTTQKEYWVYMPKYLINLVPSINGYATPDAVLTIKMSHFSWDIKWQKTKRHILLLQSLGYKPIPELYTALKQYWETIHGNKSFLSLGKNKDKFFDDFVTYRYDHDYLHELVASPNKPMYTNCLKDGEEVLIDKEKFFSMPFTDRVRMFREEITVIATERWLVHGKESWYTAYKLALKKTITSLTKNWATDFIVLNLSHFVKPEYSYFKNVLEKLELFMQVDMKPFEELLTALDVPAEKIKKVKMDNLIYALSEGDTSYLVSNLVDDLDVEHDYTSLCEQLKTNGYEHLEQEGGGEGGAEHCYGVFRLKDKIYKAEYSYYSHNGDEFDGITDTLQEVVPVEKTITVYE